MVCEEVYMFDSGVHAMAIKGTASTWQPTSTSSREQLLMPSNRPPTGKRKPWSRIAAVRVIA